MGLCSLLCLGSAVAADVIHYYDPLGRLVETVGPDGSSVQYAYDAVGNITSVRRKTAGTLSISGFIPASGDVGTTVTVMGSGFDAVVSNNAVKLNGQSVAAQTATTTSLTFQVPPGGTTGLIQVTNANGTAQSASQFVVAASKAPKLTSFAPAIAPQGTPITLSGTNFQTSAIANKVLFGRTNAAVASANSTTISALSPAGMRAGKISVTTPYGVATATTDFYAVPPGSVAADVSLTARMTVDGPTQAVSLAAGKKALLIFDGSVGQVISIGESGFSGTTLVSTLYRSDGRQLATDTFAWNGAVRVDTPLTAETYTIQIAAASTASGNVNITLSTDFVGTLPTSGAVVPFTTAKPGQRGRYTFAGTAGMNLVLNSTGSTFTDSGDLKVFNPDGTLLNAVAIGSLLYSTNLPATGTYTATVEPYRASTGTVNLSLTLSNDVNSAIAIDGSAAAAALTAGQRGNYTFTGTAGQNLGFGFTGLSGVLPTFSILKPDGSQLWTPQYPSARGSYNLTTLPVNGTYTLKVVPGDVSSAMSVSLWLSRELTGTLISGAAPTTFSTARPGQNGRYTFSATAGQNLVLNSTNNTFSQPGVITVFNPDGSQLDVTTFGSAIFSQNLSTTGTYTVFVDPDGATTGSVGLSLNLANDVTGSIVVDGAALPVTLTPGQRGTYTFAGTAGQNLGLGFTGWSGGGLPTFSILNPDGSQLWSQWPGRGSYNLPVLPATGTYKFKVVPSDPTSAMNATFSLSRDLTGVLTSGAAPITFSTTRPGQNGRYTFTATAGKNLVLTSSNSTFSLPGYINVYKPDGTLLDGVGFGGVLNSNNLPVTGTYTVFVDPDGATTGSVGLAITVN